MGQEACRVPDVKSNALRAPVKHELCFGFEICIIRCIQGARTHPCLREGRYHKGTPCRWAPTEASRCCFCFLLRPVLLGPPLVLGSENHEPRQRSEAAAERVAGRGPGQLPEPSGKLQRRTGHMEEEHITPGPRSRGRCSGRRAASIREAGRSLPPPSDGGSHPAGLLVPRQPL